MRRQEKYLMSFSHKIESRVESMKIEMIDPKILTEHPKNYREHPDDQIKHLVERIKRRGFQKNIIISKDNVIIGGHGVVKAAIAMGMAEVPAVRINESAESAEALEDLVADNEIARLGLSDDRLLSMILKDVKESGTLLGTGFDEMMLANLVMVSRTRSEIADFDAAAEWVGMPDYEKESSVFRVNVHFRSEEDRQVFAKLIGQELDAKIRSIWYPKRERSDVKSVQFE